MFGIKKKIHFTQANDFIYKTLEELFFPLEKMLKSSSNIKISDDTIKIILYEIFFFFIYAIHTTEKYKEDEYLEDLLKRISFFRPLDLKAEDYNKRFSEINEVMKFAISYAKTNGGIGSTIVGYAIDKLPSSALDKIEIIRDKEIEEKIFGVDVGSDKKDQISIYIPVLSGLFVGETYVRFAKEIENYFKKHKIINN